MDPMVRLEFSQRCPAIQNINKIIPQKFAYFETDDSCFEVNQTVIRMGIIKLYKNGKTPKWILDENRAGGSHVDLDRYGLSYRLQYGRDDENIEFIKECLEKHSMTDLERARKLEELAARKLRKDQKEPPFEQFLQVEFFEKSGSIKLKNCEFLVYDGNRIIKKAREYLSKKIFGENEKISVKTFEIGPNIMERAGMGPNPHPKRSFHFGEFSIKAEQLKIDTLIINNPIGNQLRPFLDPNHRIKRVFLNQNLPITDPIIQKTDFLIINTNNTIPFILPTISIWHRLKNPKIHLPKAGFDDFWVRRAWGSWKMEQPEIGRVWSVGFEKEEKMKGILTCFGKIEETEERGNRLYLPINEQSELMIWGEETMENDSDWCKSEWVVKIEVMAKNSAKRRKYN
ncbi:unnamed protein product [Caenorhabditis nigoni]